MRMPDRGVLVNLMGIYRPVELTQPRSKGEVMTDTLREQTARKFYETACRRWSRAGSYGMPKWDSLPEIEKPFYLGHATTFLDLVLQELTQLKPLGDEEMTQAEIAYVKKHNLSYFPVRGKYRDDCIAQASHQNVIDQITKGC